MLKIQVIVKPNSRLEAVEEVDDRQFVVKVNAPPVDGKANKRVIEVLSKHFKVPKSRIHLVAGQKGKKKTFAIEL